MVKLLYEGAPLDKIKEVNPTLFMKHSERIISAWLGVKNNVTYKKTVCQQMYLIRV